MVAISRKRKKPGVVVPCFKYSSKNRLNVLWSCCTVIFVSKEKIAVKTYHFLILKLELTKSTLFLCTWRTSYFWMYLFWSTSSLFRKHKPCGINITHMKLWLLWYCQSSDTHPFENSPDQPLGEHSSNQCWGTHPNDTVHIIFEK